ncbi:MAG: hypothetical protein ACM3UU_03590 [Ignavibacteriales bacterium]
MDNQSKENNEKDLNELKTVLSKFEKNVRNQSLKDYAERFGIKDKKKLKEIEKNFL